MKQLFSLLFVCLFLSVEAQVTVTLTGSTPSCSNPCNGTLSFSASGGNGPYTYMLIPSNMTSANGDFSGLCAGTYTVTVTDQSSNSASLSATVMLISMPMITGVTTTPIMPPMNYGAQVNYTGGQPPYYITWVAMPSQATIRIDTVNSLNDTISHLTPGDYGIYLTDSLNAAAGCIGSNNGPYTFSICDANAGNGIIIANTNDTVCSGTSVTIQFIMLPNFPLNTMIPPVYASDNANCDPSQSNGTFTCTLTQTTTFSGLWFYSMNCSPVPFQPLTIVVTTCTGIEQQENGQPAVQLSPNPSDGTFTVSSSDPGPLSVTIMDQAGRSCFTQTIRSGEQLSPSLAAGVYYCSIRSAAGVSIRKLIITGE